MIMEDRGDRGKMKATQREKKIKKKGKNRKEKGKKRKKKERLNYQENYETIDHKFKLQYIHHWTDLPLP